MPAWIVLSWALTLGYMPEYVNVVPASFSTIDAAYSSGWLNNSGSLEQTIELSAKVLDHFRIWSSVETFDTTALGQIAFYPFRSQYKIGGEIYTKGMAIGIWHECTHPVIWNTAQTFDYAAMTTEIYIKLSGSTK